MSLNTESLALAIVDNTSKLFGAMPLSVNAILLLMSRTKERLATHAASYLVMNEKMYRKLIAMPDIELLLDYTARRDLIEKGQMGVLLGMDVRVSELVEGDVMHVVVQDSNGVLAAMCSEMF
jgi:hypothetical protein